MHRRCRCVAGLLVLATATTACSDDGGDDDDAAVDHHDRAHDRHHRARPPRPPPLTGEPLVVAEQGVSTFPDLVDPQANLGGYGVVIENPNPDLMATGVRVVTRILDRRRRRAAGRQHPAQRHPPRPADGGRPHADRADRGAHQPRGDGRGHRLAPAGVDRRTAGRRGRRHRARGGRRVRHPLHGPLHLARRSRTAWTSPRSTGPRTAASSAPSRPRSTCPSANPSTASIRLLSPIPDLARTEVFVGRGFAALTIG